MVFLTMQVYLSPIFCYLNSLCVYTLTNIGNYLSISLTTHQIMNSK